MRITKPSIQRLIEMVPLGDHLSRYLEVKRSGQNAVAKCPFHQDSSPSLYIYADHYHCFACGAHGNVIDYEIHRTGSHFKDVVEQLSQMYAVSVEYEKTQQAEFSSTSHAHDKQHKWFESIQAHFKSRFSKNKTLLASSFSAFSDAGFTSNPEGLSFYLDPHDPEILIKETPEDLKQRLSLPLKKENGKIYGFAFSETISDELFDETEVFAKVKVIANHPFASYWIHWDQAKSIAAKEKNLLVLIDVLDCARLIGKGIQNAMVFLNDRFDLFSAKTFLNRIEKITFVLPLSERGKSFFWDLLEHIYPFFDSQVYVLFLPEEKTKKESFFAVMSFEKASLWISSAEKAVHKATEMLVDSVDFQERLPVFKQTILPILQKIQKTEIRKAILIDLAKKYFGSSSTDLFYLQESPKEKPPEKPKFLFQDPPVKKELNPDLEQAKPLQKIMERTCEFYHKILLSPKGEQARQYLAKRGITEQHITHWKIGFCPFENALSQKVKSQHDLQQRLESLGLIRRGKLKNQHYDFFYNRILIPIKSHQGHVVALSGRVFSDQSKAKSPKYINSAESILFSKSKILFHFFDAMEAIAKEKYVLVVEGHMDCIALVNAGIENVVAIMGTALTEDHIKSLEKLTNRIVLCFDNDPAGQKATQRSFLSIAHYPAIYLESLSLPSGKDPDEFVRQFGGQKFLELVSKQKEPLYKKICAWAVEQCHDQQDIAVHLEKAFLPVLSAKGGPYQEELLSFVKSHYDVNLRNSILAKKEQIHVVSSAQEESPSLLEEWQVISTTEVKLLFALIYLSFQDLPKRFANLLQGISSANENDEKICAMALQSNLSETSFQVIVELCSWLVAHPQQNLFQHFDFNELSNFSAASQMLLGYAKHDVKTLFSFQKEGLLKDHLSSSPSVITCKNLWSLKNSGFLRFHLYQIKLAFQGGILPSFFADILLQLEVDYIDSTLKTISSFHFDNEVNEQFQYFISERIRRQSELKVL